MAFLIRPPGQVKKAKAKLKPKSKNAQDILNRMQGFLQQNTSEPVEILCSFWEDQKNAVTYKELREVVQSGMLTQKQFEDWQQDYSVLVEQKLAGVWQSAMAAGVAGQPMFDSLSFSINTQDPGIASWIKDRGAEFVTSCTAEQKKAIQSLLAKKITDQHTVDELARFIRPCIGLTDSDTKAVLKLYDSAKATLQTNHPRMKPENIRKKALDTAQKYAEKKHRQRAFTIAQTELEFAYNRGADQGVRQAQSQGLIGKTIKRWITSGDDAVCSVCAALDGTEIEMDDNFDFKGRLLFAGQKMLPPAHPRCACAVEYIEVEPPVFQPENITETEIEVATENEVDKRRKVKMKKFSDMIQKSGDQTESKARESPEKKVKKRMFKITKRDDEKMLAFGWANVSIRSDGELIEDWQEDIVEPEDLEQAAYEFVQLYREGGEMHERGGVATLVESVVFTEEKQRAMGIPEGTLPVGWWIGFKVLDADVWEKVKDGTYSMFSIEGEAERVEVKDEGAD